MFDIEQNYLGGGGGTCSQCAVSTPTDSLSMSKVC